MFSQVDIWRSSGEDDDLKWLVDGSIPGDFEKKN